MRIARLLVATAMLTTVLALAPSATAAVGPCIGPITKSAIYTYQNAYDQVQFDEPVRYHKFKLTATFCYDSFGNAWGAGPISYQVISGAFVGISNLPKYVTSSGFAYATIQFGFYKVLDPVIRQRIAPVLKISGVNGRFTAFDNQAAVVSGTGAVLSGYGNVFVSAALQ